MGAITTAGLTKKFGKLTAVDDLDLDIKEGEIFGLLGPNGAGKTTTISMLATLLAPTSGTATVANQDILKNPSKVREHIGIVFQDPSSDDILTGRENLYLHGLMYGVPFIKELHSAAVKKGLIARDPSPKPDYSPGPWEYVEQERQINYDWPLKKILLAYYEARFPIPSATQVLLDWRENMPQGISKVSEDGFSYLNLNLEEKTCMKRSLQEAIDRRTKLATTWPD